MKSVWFLGMDWNSAITMLDCNTHGLACSPTPRIKPTARPRQTHQECSQDRRCNWPRHSTIYTAHNPSLLSSCGRAGGPARPAEMILPVSTAACLLARLPVLYDELEVHGLSHHCLGICAMHGVRTLLSLLKARILKRLGLPRSVTTGLAQRMAMSVRAVVHGEADNSSFSSHLRRGSVMVQFTLILGVEL
jgi:hypothetical protein